MTVTGTSEFNDTVDVDANFAVRTSGGTDKFTVASATGNTVIQGDLSINGSLTATALTGNADSATQIKTQSSSANSTHYLTFVDSNNVSNTAEALKTDASITYNPSSDTLNVTNITATLTGDVTGNISGNAGSATQLQTSRSIGGVSFNGTADIDLPGVNTGGNQNTSGTATNADNINIDETNSGSNFQITFTAQNDSGYNRQYIDTDDAALAYNPASNTLGGLNINADNIQANVFGDDTQNAYGTRTVNTGGPSGGSNGDIHYKI